MRRHKHIAPFVLLWLTRGALPGAERKLVDRAGRPYPGGCNGYSRDGATGRVTDAGNVPLAYVGSIHVAGQTPDEAAAMIQKALIDKKVMLHPQVTVKLTGWPLRMCRCSARSILPVLTPSPLHRQS